MPYSMEEMQREMDRMGDPSWLIAYGPRETVRENMAVAGVKSSSAEVARLWEAYYEAVVKKGLAPYTATTGAGALLNSMAQSTGLPLNTVAAYLNGLYQAVRYQGWDPKWLDPGWAVEQGKPLTVAEDVKEKLTQTGEAVGAFLKPTLDPVTNLVKYAAVGLVAGAVIYGVYHGTKIFKFKRRRRKG